MNDLTTGAAKISKSRSHLPLAGIRIIDCTHAMAGPYATSLMGDLGADIIKIEGPEGDFIRKMDRKMRSGESIYFHSINRSKRSLVIDLTKPEGYALLQRLLETADVFLTNMSLPAVRKLKLDYDSISQIQPKLVYGSITAFGASGPRATEPGLDLLGQAVSGIMGMTGEHDGPPVRTGPSITDIVTAFLLCFSVTAALRARDRDGIGQKIELNLTDCGFATMPNLVTEYLYNKIPLSGWGSGHPQAVPYQAFLARDGYFVIACLSDKVWRKLQLVLNKEFFSDTRFDKASGRLEHRPELIDALQKLFLTETRSYWLNQLKHSGIPSAPVNTLSQAVNDSQILYNKMLRIMHDPINGDYTVIDNPIKMSRTPAEPFGPAPELGEHSEIILQEAGLSKIEIEQMAKNGIIRCHRGS